MIVDFSAYITQCSKNIAVATMQAIIKTESKGNYLAIGLNKGYKLKYQPRNYIEACQWVDYLERHGYDFDIGLTQVNIKNAHKYGYTAAQALNPCINIRIAGKILEQNYNKALYHSKTTQEVLYKAISAYNTGNYFLGFTNGYVQRVIANAYIK